MNRRTRFRPTLCVTGLLSLAAARPARALTLVSPSLDVLPTDQLVCRIVNAGTKPIKVTMQVIDAVTGQAAVEDVLTIAPGTADVIAAFDQGLTGYCRFEGTFKRADVRASLDVFSGDHTVLITPAR